ncbi:MAG: nickel ABC transporter permease [Trueperaceae bacterium]|nr:nickel ABC transporter permease [Trueperaceae bacterium]
MFSYFIRRLLAAIPTVFGVLIIVFLMVRLAPGDPALYLAGEFAPPETIESIRERYGLNRSQPEQFVIFISNVVRGDLGRSTRTNRPVVEDLKTFFPNTLELAFGAILIALLVGIPAGVISAVRPNTPLDYLVTLGSLIGVSMPVFWFGLLAILFFSVQLGWFPVAGRGTLAHLVLPAITLGVSSMAIITRMTRSAMLEILSQDYVRTARSKGLRQERIVNKHALRNALIPVVTVGGLEFGTLMAGAVLTETVFTWPGIGRLLVDSILARDYPVVQGAVMLIAVSFILINLLVDMLYGLVDPRIRYD